MAALCVVFLFLGSVITVLDLSFAAMSSIVIVLAVIELGGSYPWLIWAVVSILSLLLLPDKFGAVTFLVFAGYYPIIKKHIEGLHSLVIQWILKLIVFNAAITLIIAVSVFILKLPTDEIGFGIIVYGLCNITFIIFDIALTKLIALYLFRFRNKFKFFKK